MLKYGTKKFSSHHMNYVLVEAWYAFKMSAVNIIREIFAKKKLLPLSPPYLTTNTQAYAASIQVSSGAKTEEKKYIMPYSCAYQVTGYQD